jgi:hypothetical protein
MVFNFRYKIAFFVITIGLAITGISGCSSTSSVSSEPVNSAPGTTTTFILLRHAERAKAAGESALTEPGRARAQALVAAISNMNITAIYCPDRGRNRETGMPLADSLGIPLNLVLEERLVNSREFADEFVLGILSKHAGEKVVWIGNKSPVGIWGGNLKEIYLRLGGTGEPPSKYDDLFIIEVPDEGQIQITKKTYGIPAGRFDQ